MVFFGELFNTRANASGSRSVPFGDPSWRREILPPAGSFVAAVIPESSSALELTQMVW